MGPVIRMLENTLLNAPNGQAYLHQNFLIKIEPMTTAPMERSENSKIVSTLKPLTEPK